MIHPRPRHALALTLALLCAPAPAEPTPGDGQLIGDDIARFVPAGTDVTSLPPSLALVKPPVPTGPVPASFIVHPRFDHADGRYVAHIDTPDGTSLYGTGETAGPLLRNGRTSECWNTDAYGYDESTPSLYQSHPWVLAVRPDGTAFGVLADTTWRCAIDLTDGIEFRAEGLPYEVVVIDRPSPQQVVQTLSQLTGRMPMPPEWAIGYHQCRYSYAPAARVREIAAGFRDHRIPCDVIWMDIDYMRGYRIFTFDPEGFPDPAALNKDLHKEGFHSIWMIDPGVKAEPGYSVYDSGQAHNVWVRNAAGEVYNGDVWPGACVFPDYTSPDVRTWWAGLYHDFLATGVDGVWNDMNEPAIFNVDSKTMPEDNRHAGGGGLPPGPHARYHNVYGMLMARATREGIQAANPDKRPFVLTRADYIGGQRYGATWTGDNSAEWDDLEASIPMVLNLGLSGQPFCGPDIGGFIGNGTPDLYARWMGFGALLPFSRGHTAKGNIDKEPWAFGTDVEKTCRQALDRRYRLLPYLYTLFHDASTTGMPVARPVFFADPGDPALRSEDDAFLLGSDLLVVPQLTPDRDRVPVTPRGDWRPITLVGEGDNPDLPRLLVRAGAIIPIGPVMQHTGEKPLDPLTLLVCPDKTGSAEGWLYEDAGDGYGYRRGKYLLTHYVARTVGRELKVQIADTNGDMPRPKRKIRVQIIEPTP